VPGAQLTWMDARVGDRVVTPRIGKLRGKNLLHVKGNTITVQKPRELQKLLQENLGEL